MNRRMESMMSMVTAVVNRENREARRPQQPQKKGLSNLTSFMKVITPNLTFKGIKGKGEEGRREAYDFLKEFRSKAEATKLDPDDTLTAFFLKMEKSAIRWFEQAIRDYIPEVVTYEFITWMYDEFIQEYEGLDRESASLLRAVGTRKKKDSTYMDFYRELSEHSADNPEDFPPSMMKILLKRSLSPDKLQTIVEHTTRPTLADYQRFFQKWDQIEKEKKLFGNHPDTLSLFKSEGSPHPLSLQAKERNNKEANSLRQKQDVALMSTKNAFKRIADLAKAKREGQDFRVNAVRGEVADKSPPQLDQEEETDEGFEQVEEEVDQWEDIAEGEEELDDATLETFLQDCEFLSALDGLTEPVNNVTQQMSSMKIRPNSQETRTPQRNGGFAPRPAQNSTQRPNQGQSQRSNQGQFQRTPGNAQQRANTGLQPRQQQYNSGNNVRFSNPPVQNSPQASAPTTSQGSFDLRGMNAGQLMQLSGQIRRAMWQRDTPPPWAGTIPKPPYSGCHTCNDDKHFQWDCPELKKQKLAAQQQTQPEVNTSNPDASSGNSTRPGL